MLWLLLFFFYFNFHYREINNNIIRPHIRIRIRIRELTKKGEYKLEEFKDGFGARRKRAAFNVSDRTNNSDGVTYHGIQWGNENQQKEDFKELEYKSEEEIELNEGSLDVAKIDGIAFKLKTTTSKKKFSDTHVRITTYLEKDLHKTIQLMNNQGYVDSITQIINDSVKSYLLDNYRN